MRFVPQSSNPSPSAVLDDVERILFHEQTILSRLDELARAITDEYRDRELTVVAVMNGSLIFAAAGPR